MRRLGEEAISIGNDKEVVTAKFQKISGEIDHFVYNLFELTKEEIVCIEKHFEQFGEDYPQFKKVKKEKSKKKSKKKVA